MTVQRRPLTRRQLEIYEFIVDFIEKRRYSPTLDEMCEHFGLRSVATVQKHVTNLEKAGWIRRLWNRARSIEVVGMELRPPGYNVTFHCRNCGEPNYVEISADGERRSAQDKAQGVQGVGCRSGVEARQGHSAQELPSPPLDAA